MIRIQIYNGKSKLSGDRVDIEELREIFKLKSPGAFWSAAKRRGVWDGYVRYVTEAGHISTGLLPELIELAKKLDIGYEFMDMRENFKDLYVPEELNGNKFIPHQQKALENILNHRLEKIRFIRGVVWAATNSGKSYIMGGTIQAFSSKRKTIVLFDETDVYLQHVEDFKKFFPGEVGEIGEGKCQLDKRITLCMVPTLKNQIDRNIKVRQFLQTIDIVLADECDKATSARWAKCLNHLFNATIRLGFSGTAQLHKDPTKNKMIIAFFGPIIYRITNKELVDTGVSTKPIFKIFTGTQDIKIKGDYKGEYDQSITLNISRNKKVWSRVIKHKAKGRLPLIILFKYKEHAVELLKHLPKELKDLSVDYVHSGRSKLQRKAVIDRFKRGQLDVLLASYVLKRGKNLPLIKVLINASSGDSHINALQILGRLLRKHESKDVVYFEDFFDKGAYLQRHSKHRIRYYKQEGFEVKELYKK